MGLGSAKVSIHKVCFALQGGQYIYSSHISYCYFQWKRKMKDFTNFALPRNCKFSFSCLDICHRGKLWTIFRYHEHPKRVVSFKERDKRGRKSSARSLSWKSGWSLCTVAASKHWTFPKTFLDALASLDFKLPLSQSISDSPFSDFQVINDNQW